MMTVEFSKCYKCGMIKPVPELKDNPDSVGMICIDTDKCKQESATIEGNTDEKK